MKKQLRNLALIIVLLLVSTQNIYGAKKSKLAGNWMFKIPSVGDVLVTFDKIKKSQTNGRGMIGNFPLSYQEGQKKNDTSFSISFEVNVNNDSLTNMQGTAIIRGNIEEDKIFGELYLIKRNVATEPGGLTGFEMIQVAITGEKQKP